MIHLCEWCSYSVCIRCINLALFRLACTQHACCLVGSRQVSFIQDVSGVSNWRSKSYFAPNFGSCPLSSIYSFHYQHEPSTIGTWPILFYRIPVLKESQNDYRNTGIYTYCRPFFIDKGLQN